jgi:hypothetical protein
MVALGFKEARANRNARETKKKYEWQIWETQQRQKCIHANFFHHRNARVSNPDFFINTSKINNINCDTEICLKEPECIHGSDPLG